MDDAELIEQTMIFDAIEWPEQAHMMSAPTRKHVSDAAWEAIGNHAPAVRDLYEIEAKRRGTVLLTVAEHDELLASKKDAPYVELQSKWLEEARAERDELRAEVERLTIQARNWEADAQRYAGNADYWRDRFERLRKEWDETRQNVQGGADGVLAKSGQRIHAAQRITARTQAVHAAIASGADTHLRTLDPRLGTQLPDGEPVEPMSARKAYRWGMV